MQDTYGVYNLASVLNTTNLNEHEKNFVSKISIESWVKDAFQVPRMAPQLKDPDFIDEIISNEAWGKIYSLMGEKDFQEMWKHKFVFFEMSENIKISLNGRMTLEDKTSPWGKNERNGIRLMIEGYSPRTLVDRKSYVGKRFPCGRNVIPTDYQSVCELIENQETGVRCENICNYITPKQCELMKIFLQKKFSLGFFKKKLLQGSCKSIVDINSFVKNILESHVPRDLIGSKKAFERMKSNICLCFKTNSRFPLRLGTLMKGLPSLDFRGNAFLCKFVLFLTNVFVSSVVFKLLYVTESLKNKQVIYFKKKSWRKYENAALQKMVNTGVLTASTGVSYGPQVSKLRILYKTKGFRPLVTPSTRHKRIRYRLYVCNTFLKQIVNQINPAYGHVLNALHSQWNNLGFSTSEKLYFIRTDVSDAFQSIVHSKLLEILDRRLSRMDPVQTCRTFEYRCGMRKKSVLQFTKICPRLHKKTVFCEAGKKVYTTSYLKAVMIQYIKHNYVCMNRREVLQHINGLPQGCYLSSILCELYLADMDDFYFNHLKSEKDVFIRGMDDYLYMTSDLHKANAFLQLITEGIRDYGIKFQHTKTVTNFGCPMACFPFFGYTFYPRCRKIEPDFSEWTDDITSRMHFNPKMTWADLSRRMKMVTHIKLHGLTLDSKYLHKFAIMKNVYLSSKIHAAKYKAIHNFLVENGNPPPSLDERLKPIIAASRVITSKVLSINKDKNALSHLEVKVVVLKGFQTVLGPTGPFRRLVEQLNATTGRMVSTRSISTRFKKLLKSLVKNFSEF